MYTVITGATKGIGKELAYKFAQKGHNLILIARSLSILIDMKRDLEERYFIDVIIYQCNLNDLEKVISLFHDIKEKYAINCLINNAGISYWENIGEISLFSLNEQINVNLQAPILITNILITNLRQNKGSVINLCSVLSYLPNTKSSVYTASKFALYGFSNVLRLENPWLHVLTVHPITVKTDFFKDPNYINKTKHILNPDKVADLIYKSYIRKKRKCHIPRYVGFLNILYQLFPKTMDYFNRKHFSNK